MRAVLALPPSLLAGAASLGASVAANLRAVDRINSGAPFSARQRMSSAEYNVPEFSMVSRTMGDVDPKHLDDVFTTNSRGLLGYQKT